MHDKAPTIPIDDRLRLNALLDRLLGPGETFDLAEAAEVVRLAPPTGGHPVVRVVNRDARDASTRGHAAGIGDVEIRDRGPAREVTRMYGPPPVRVGHYQMSHKRGTILFELMSSMTRADRPGQHAVLRYDPATGIPWRLDYSVPLNLRVYYWWRRTLTLNFIGFEPWKLPAAAGGTP